VDQALELARETAAGFVKLAEVFWPGALTIVVEAGHGLPLKVTAGTGRIALRWPRCEVVRQLISEVQGPITGTSANISGFPSCASADQVMKQLGDRLPLVLDSGETGAALPSTIVQLNGSEWKILREGAIPLADIEKALQ
jgi:L-threonylcarbamoyladenylate synthase